jgi:hypothetical protein
MNIFRHKPNEALSSFHRIVGRANFLLKHNGYSPVLLLLDGHKVLPSLW